MYARKSYEKDFSLLVTQIHSLIEMDMFPWTDEYQDINLILSSHDETVVLLSKIDI